VSLNNYQVWKLTSTRAKFSALVKLNNKKQYIQVCLVVSWVHIPVGEFRKTRHPRNVEFNVILEICFSGAGNSRFSGIWNLRSFGFANVWISGILNWWRPRVMNTRKPGISNSRRHEFRRTADSGICRKFSSEVMRGGVHESAKKQSQSCRPKKSGFWVWTGGRLVNMLDEKDILVCVHIRNILWAWGRFRNVKVPSSPYKRGREGTCKRIQTFGSCAIDWEIHCLLSY
jgi:hypothetical protein